MVCQISPQTDLKLRSISTVAFLLAMALLFTSVSWVASLFAAALDQKNSLQAVYPAAFQIGHGLFLRLPDSHFAHSVLVAWSVEIITCN